MRVLSIGSTYPPHALGGLEVVWQAANRALREAGHRVRVLATDTRLPDVAAGAAEEPDVHRELRWYWRDHGFPRLGLRERVEIERHNARVLARHLAGLRADAVCWWSLGGMSLSLVEGVRRAGVPAVGVVCDDWMLYAPEVDAWTRPLARRPWLAPLAERVTGVPARFDPGPAARWLFISEHVRRGALARHPLPDSGLAHPGVALDRFAPGEPRPWGWRLLYAGRIDPRKGIALAVEALAELPAEATLSVDGAGDEAHLAELRALADRLGVAGRVRFERSPRERLADAYRAADAVVFPVVWEEPWGLVPLEAMACGTPVVATGRGGSGEYLRHGGNALVFDPDAGAGALAAALRRLAADAALRERLRSGGLATVRRFPEEAFNAAVVRALEEVAR